MRKPLIAGNWKMYGSQEMARDLLGELKAAADLPVNIAVFPPFVYLPCAAEQLKAGEIGLGAQNLSSHEGEGAYTGEVSGAMLREIGCQYVLVGHSERRQYYHETDESCTQKVIAAQSVSLLPILCVGETLQERQKKQTLTVIEKQLAAVINHEAVDHTALIIAYEPVWAIGTGQNATPTVAQEVHGFIRQLLSSWIGEKAAQACILLYGGSVKADNAHQLLAMPDIDGALVGGASLKAASFIAICEAAAKSLINEENR
jgi:triosephosphate isomerase